MSTTISNKVYQWVRSVHYSVLPGTCVLCKRLTGCNADICLKCLNNTTRHWHACRYCAVALPIYDSDTDICGECLNSPPAFSHCVSACLYESPVDQLISQFKYSGKLHYGRVLSDLLIAKLAPRLNSVPCQSTSIFQPPQLLIPVPLHPRRLRHRGYNQALLIARQIGKAFDIAVDHRSCERRLDTPPQRGMDRQDRQANIRKAFCINQSPALQDIQSVALIDDVVTTGSTVREISTLLRKEGIPSIYIWSLARAC